MSDDWLNWQQFDDLNHSEVQRQADAAQQANDDARAQMDQAIAGLGSQYDAAARRGTLGDPTQYADYSALMDRQQQELNKRPATTQMMGWESGMYGGQNPQGENPWGELQKRLGDMTQDYTRLNTNVQQDQAQAKAAQQQAAFNRQQSQQTDFYRKWNDARYQEQLMANKFHDENKAAQDRVGYSGQTSAWGGAAASGWGQGDAQSVAWLRQQYIDQFTQQFGRAPTAQEIPNFGNLSGTGGQAATARTGGNKQEGQPFASGGGH